MSGWGSTASTIAALARWGTDSNVTIKGADYFGISIGLVVLWILMLAGVRAYDRRVIGLGSDEFRRVFEAAVRAAALVALITFVGKLPLSRGYVAMALPLGLVFAFGLAAMLVSPLGFAGGFVARRYSLATSLWIGGTVQALATLSFSWLALVGVNQWALAVAICHAHHLSTARRIS